MAKYGKKAQEKISEVMKEFGKGKLRSGSGKKVKNRDQAIAIAVSEAREKGLKVGSAPKGTGKKKDEMTRQELYERAKRRNIKGRSSMNKDELKRALEK